MAPDEERGWASCRGDKTALKEIRLEFEEGAPCTAIREGNFELYFTELIDRRLNYLLIVRSFMRSDIMQFSFTFARTQTSKYCHSSRHNSYADKPDPSV